MRIQHPSHIHEQARRLARAAGRGIGIKKASKILNQVGGIEDLCNMTREEFVELDHVGPATASQIGIWDEGGNPTGEIPKNPCPNCTEEYDRRERGNAVTVGKDSKVCFDTEFTADSPFVFIHKE